MIFVSILLCLTAAATVYCFVNTGGDKPPSNLLLEKMKQFDQEPDL